jgi:glucose/arabinose dehydrogenase
VVLAAAVLVAALAGEASPAGAAGTLPPGFTDALIASVSSPTSLAFTPDGRMLVTTQGGLLRAYSAGSLALIRNALVMGTRVCANEERGLLGVAVDPDFASNRYIYLFYTFNKHGVCPSGEVANPDNPVNRVSRFVLGDDSRAALSSETVLIDNIPSVDGDHNAGDLRFGQDGYLYVSVGDNDCNYLGGPCGGGNEASRDEHILLGKILRVTPDGGIPASNPFQGADSDRCHVTGRTTPGRRCRETFAWGLRNPFRMAFDPNAAGTRFFINDVGQYAREEINLGQAGADYGWNCREGTAANSTSGKCDPAPSGMVPPIYDYPHSSGCSAITGGVFVPNGVWPAAYDGDYLFGDYVCGKIFRMEPQAGGGYAVSDFATGLGQNSAVAMTFGPFGNSQALYYTTYAGGGQIRRLAQTQTPSAEISASPNAGPLPLAVAFSAAGSTDPLGQPLTFDWNFGDGAALSGGSQVTTTHTYQTAGVFTATVVARNSLGLASDPAAVRVWAGNRPPAPVISLPAAGSTFASGQVIQLQGAASDPDQGALPAAALRWEVILHHVDEVNPGNAHTHPHFDQAGTASTAFMAPPAEDFQATKLSYVEVVLTATDSQGLTARTTRAVLPRRVEGTFETEPAGLGLTVNGVVFTAPRTFTLWEGWRIEVSAPAAQTDASGKAWRFAGWSDGGAATHTITTPAGNAMYRAAYALVAPEDALRLFLPLVRSR